MVHSGVFLYYWATAGPPNVAGPGVAYPLTPPSRRASISFLYVTIDNVPNVFFPDTVYIIASCCYATINRFIEREDARNERKLHADFRSNAANYLALIYWL